MNKKIKIFLYVIIILFFSVIVSGTLLIYFSVLNIGDNNVSFYIHKKENMLCIIVPSLLILVICIFKFAAFIKRKKVQDRVFNVDTEYSDEEYHHAVGSFLERQQKHINAAAKKANYVAVQSTQNLKDTSNIVSDALKENDKFIRYVSERSVSENKIAAKKLRKDAKPVVDKISESKKYRKK